jgi:hypothetical protein
MKKIHSRHEACSKALGLALKLFVCAAKAVSFSPCKNAFIKTARQSIDFIKYKNHDKYI